jgi:hypothetical protein
VAAPPPRSTDPDTTADKQRELQREQDRKERGLFVPVKMFP